MEAYEGNQPRRLPHDNFMMPSTTGYSKICTFDFTEEGDINRKDGTWLVNGVLLYLSSENLFMPNGYITAPHIYEGDLKATVSFLLDTGVITPYGSSTSFPSPTAAGAAQKDMGHTIQ